MIFIQQIKKNLLKDYNEQKNIISELNETIDIKEKKIKSLQNDLD